MNPTVSRLYPLLLLQLLLLSGCTYVRLTDQGAQVTQGAAADVANCTQVGVVSANTRAKVVVKRVDGKVREELLVLARNEAANLGANTIVPDGEPVEGKQSFRAYRCDPASA